MWQIVVIIKFCKGTRFDANSGPKIIAIKAPYTCLLYTSPLLHEIATGVMDDGTDSLSYRAHGKNHHFSFEQGSITRINREQKYVELAPVYGQEGDMLVVARRIPYDYLVIAIGSKSNDFNTKGVADNCIFLDSSDQALRFQQRMLELFLKFSENRALDDIGEEEFKQKLVDESKVNIAIVGGGATGVELTAEPVSYTHLPLT